MSLSYEVRDSDVHGKGVFSLKPIRKDSVICTPLKVNYYIIVDISQDVGVYINHSWCPNSKLVKRSNELVWDLVAIEDIKKGDEIRMDYRDTPWFISKPLIWYK